MKMENLEVVTQRKWSNMGITHEGFVKKMI